MSCKFCQIASSKVSDRVVDRVLHETDEYFAVSSIGGFIPGWVVVCTKAHALNLSKKYADESFVAFVNEVQNGVKSEYGECVVFEHGAITEGSITACGVNHAHLHIVPFSQSIESLVAKEDLSLNWMKCLAEDIDPSVGGQEYLFCTDKFSTVRTSGLVSVLAKPQSQFFRRVLSRAVGMAEFYNYKYYPFEEISSNTTQKLSGIFATANIAE